MRLDEPLYDTESAIRPITVRDLLIFRMGFGTVIVPPDVYPIQKAVSEQQIMTPAPLTSQAPDEWIRRFATLPLMYQPGEKWMYNTFPVASAASAPLLLKLALRVISL